MKISDIIIRLGWKGLPRINTPPYYGNPYIKVKKSFITLTPGPRYSFFEFKRKKEETLNVLSVQGDT